jgi:signal transduction histidine kinase
MDPDRGESTGLSYMREQMLSVDGTFVVTSLPDKGIIVEASAPTGIMPQSQD